MQRTLGDYPALSAYNHLGDIVHFEYGGIGYLVVPLEGQGVVPAITVLLSSDLAYVHHASLREQVKCGWCAVDPSGYLYSSEGQPTALLRYSVNWAQLPVSGVLQVELIGPQNLYNEVGAALQLHHMQGGEFSPSGELLYLVSGFFEDTDETAEGIHVFDTQSWRRVQHSTNGAGYFNFEFHTGCCDYEEPEGLTIWDLEDGRAPNIGGQLHVLLLDNDVLDADEIFLKHYSASIFVDRGYLGTELGTATQPFNTVTEANNLAWNGARVAIKAGFYPETLTFSRRMKVSTAGGLVRIGP